VTPVGADGSRLNVDEKLWFLHATLPDPDGHHTALRLKGDWQIIGSLTGRKTGVVKSVTAKMTCPP